MAGIDLGCVFVEGCLGFGVFVEHFVEIFEVVEEVWICEVTAVEVG